MQLRRAAPAVFALLCLGLSGLVLRRQIAAHPAPPPPPDFPQLQSPPGGDVPRPALGLWQTASEPARREALSTIQSQLMAIRTGDADRAWFYQSRALRANFHSAQEFQGMISRRFPEFGHARSAEFGPVWTDKSGQYAGVIVTVRGENGRRARGRYMLLREDGGYKVASVIGGGPLRESAP